MVDVNAHTMNPTSYCDVWRLLTTDAVFARNHERRQTRIFLVNIILFTMKTSNAAGDLMVGSGVIAVGTFQVPGEATISPCISTPARSSGTGCNRFSSRVGMPTGVRLSARRIWR